MLMVVQGGQCGVTLTMTAIVTVIVRGTLELFGFARWVAAASLQDAVEVCMNMHEEQGRGYRRTS